MISSIIGNGSDNASKSKKIDQLIARVKNNLGLKENYVYFVAGNIAKLVHILEGITKIETEAGQDGSENYENRYLLQKQKYGQILSILVEKLSSANVSGTGYRASYFWLVLRLASYHLENLEAGTVSEDVLNHLTEKTKSLLTKQNLKKIWLEIVKDDKCNTKLIVPYYNTVSQIAAQDVSTFYPIILKFFASVLKSLDNSKDLIQKKAMHFSLFFGSVVQALGFNTFTGVDGVAETFKSIVEEQMELEGNNKLEISNGAGRNPLAVTLIHSLQFWLKQCGQKAQLSKQASKKVENSLVAALDQSVIGSGKKNKGIKEQI